MAHLLLGKATCTLCGNVVSESQSFVAFPAFIPNGHEFSAYSDGVFHLECFEHWEHHARFQRLFEAYETIWESRPKGLTFDRMEAWGRRAFSELFSSETTESCPKACKKM